jgi:hypothetical protein
MSGLRGLVAEALPLTTAAEREQLRKLFVGLHLDPPFDAEWRALLALVREGPDPLGPAPGSALALLVSSRPFARAPFGVARPLVVQARYTREVSRLVNRASDEAVHQGFLQGVAAAVELVVRHGPRALGFAQLIHSCSFVGTMQGLPLDLRVEGPSLGLAAAVAVVSELSGVAVDPGVGFTGCLDVKGAVGRVAGVRAKLLAARDKGIRRVFLPADNARDVPKDLEGAVEIRPVARLERVVDEVFGLECVTAKLDRLFAEKRPPATVKAQRWIAGADDAGGARRVLLTFVSKADPQGRYLGRDRAPIAAGEGEGRSAEEREGPTLATVRMLRPHAVYLLHTTEPETNDLRENMLATKRFLARSYPDLAVTPVPLPELRDPSDYEQLVPAVRSAVERIKRQETGPGTRWFVNVSSGTPAMESTWHLLREWRVLDATLLQVREARYLTTPGEPRIREVVLPIP